MERNRSGALRRSYRRHALWTVITLGAILLVGVAVGFMAEMALQALTAPPGDLELVHRSLQHTVSLVFASLQAVLPLVGGLVAAPLLIARLLHKVHGTSTIHQAHDRLNQLLFGPFGSLPRLLVKEGHIASGKDSVIRRVGGPATLTVYGDSAVVTEQHGRLKRVLGRGVHTLDPYERVWETVDLRPQRWVREVFGLTKEGIPVSCDVDMFFQIDDSAESARHRRRARDRDQVTETALPSRGETVLRAATSTWVRREDGGRQAMDWQDRVASLVESALRDILATYRLDWLIKAPQPDQQHPRDEIHERLSLVLRDQLSAVGAKLLDVNIGQLHVGVQETGGAESRRVSEKLSDIISHQWVDAWQARWKARALTTRAEGEAELLRIDTARIEAQAEMVIGLTEILQPLVATKPTSEPYLLALRLVEALQGMSYDPRTRDYMPPEALRTLNRLQELVDSELTTPDGAQGTGRGGEPR